jgi:hypothetical protein
MNLGCISQGPKDHACLGERSGMRPEAMRRECPSRGRINLRRRLRERLGASRG